MRVIVGITGASGAAVAVRVLERLTEAEAEVDLVISKWGAVTLRHEQGLSRRSLARLATNVFSDGDMAAPISSGSVPVDSMLIVPCSVRTLGAIASGVGDNLIARAAEVTLKERRRLVIGLRETPLNDIHLRNMLDVSRAGAVIFPLTPAFYALPQTIDEMVDFLAMRLLDLAGIKSTGDVRWSGKIEPVVNDAD